MTTKQGIESVGEIAADWVLQQPKIGPANDRRISQVVIDAQWVTNNAQLIAAAPELLEALQECLAWFDLDPRRNHPIMAQDTEVGFRMIQQAEAAIAKATGKAGE